MRSHDGQLLFAATDLSRFLACRRLTTQSRRVALGEARPPPVFPDPRGEALAEAGREHEARILERFRARGLFVEAIGASGGFADRAGRTVDAMRRGVEVIHQGALGRGAWSGYPDFLVRVPTTSAFGDWSYEVVDAKLATVAKADAVLQIAVYSWLLERAQGTAPIKMHLALGGAEERESFRVAEFAAFERALRREFEEHCADPAPTYPEPVDLCLRCDWNRVCADRRRDDDHLSLVAGASRHQRKRLEARGVTTLAALAGMELPLDPPPEGVHRVSLKRIRRQAKAQLTGRQLERPFHELIHPPEAGRGLLKLPEPSAGDLFFDIESSRPGANEALEYLFGFVDRDGRYEDRWAFDRDGERRIFENFMDLVAERLERFPDLRVYHYGGYETGALKRLMSRYATREDAMDGLLRRGVFVDLLRVTKQGLVASVESYSLKSMEPFYGFAREQELPEAHRARARVDALLDGGEAGAVPLAKDRDVIRRYNREDCLSTLALHGWLEDRRRELTARIGPRDRPVVTVDPAKQEKQTEAAQRVAELVERLETGPVDELEARRLLGYLLDYYRREDKSKWWEFFGFCELDALGLVEDRTALGALRFDCELGPEKRSVLHRYRFPSQDHGIAPGSYVVDPGTTRSPGGVHAIGKNTVVLKRSRKKLEEPHPEGLFPFADFPTDTMRDSLFRLGELVAGAGFPDDHPRRAAFDLLRRAAPRRGGASLAQPEEDPVDAARRVAIALDREVLAVQGPPGSGKTFLGARVITELVRAGRTVGVTAQSHKVITHLLDKVCAAADEEKVELRGMQITPGDGCRDERVTIGTSGNAAGASRDPNIHLIAGTTWVWAREDMQDSVDTLVVDEAGQFSLAAALASAPAARNLVLLGDPAQLDQVTQGVHPGGSDASVLGHLLAGEKTITPDRGLFLDRTWRLHPDICRFTSELFYEDRLGSRPNLERQAVRGGPLPGAGLRYVAVGHDGNQRESVEEAERIAALVDGLLADASWTDQCGTTRRITPKDILIVAPYNAQVDLLRAHVAEGVEVGTVDRFQGREAPVVLYSLATSTPDAAPRGMDFLYSLNRLNVATSRARCLAVVVASPELFFPECRTPHQMRLANAFCRFRELAEEVR